MKATDIERDRLFQEELLITEATELIYELLQRSGTSKSELADRVGKTRGFVTQLLNGTRNMTLRTLADLAFALDRRISVAAAPVQTLSARTASRLLAGAQLGNRSASRPVTFSGNVAGVGVRILPRGPAGSGYATFIAGPQVARLQQRGKAAATMSEPALHAAT
jgi:transcriptional regulator with XRE-family HTH domain